MYPLLRTTPLAGARLTAYLRSLILEFGTYHPPFASLAGSANTAPRPTRVPPEILTDAVVDGIKTSCCFVGRPLDPTSYVEDLSDIVGIRSRMMSPTAANDDRMDIDTEPSRTLRVEIPSGRRSGIQSGAQSGAQTPLSQAPTAQGTWASRYEQQSTATDFLVQVNPPPPLTGTGKGSIRIPGWVRERAAEVLFQGGDVDEASVAEVILQTTLKVQFYPTGYN
jgi:actin-related protein 10